MLALRRVKGFHQRSAQYEQILKKNEQMFALLAVTTALCPAALSDLNETVLNLLQEKCASPAPIVRCHPIF
jgi:translation initiation factor 3 subunit L